jgi:hypothetical protein
MLRKYLNRGTIFLLDFLSHNPDGNEVKVFTKTK